MIQVWISRKILSRTVEVLRGWLLSPTSTLPRSQGLPRVWFRALSRASCRASRQVPWSSRRSLLKQIPSGQLFSCIPATTAV